MLGGDLSMMERSGEAEMISMAEATVKMDEIETGIGRGASEDEDKDADADVGKGDEEGDKVNDRGNRWPRQETVALLKIRLDMDGAFRDSSLKGPLWEEVARKLAQHGYKRNAKKCKEKFENVYKYHKRTKEGRSGKPEGKTYKFFDELQALENQYTKNTESSKLSHVTNINYTIISPPPPPLPPPLSVLGNPTPTTATVNSRIPPCQPFPARNMSANVFLSASTSSSTASDEGLEERYRRKRKWKDYFKRLARKLIMKQEEMQNRFLESIDKRDHERKVREEAWRVQEMGKINREHEILIQERSTAAAKDAAVIAFLQKLSGQQNPIRQPCSQPQQQPVEAAVIHGDCASPASSSRWPKTEVHALITLRTNLDSDYHENNPKGPLWEEISEGMRKLGYNRNAKKCKEKWENINKYFKKVKEGNKKRPQDSKTCPYFHQLQAIYKEKTKTSSENSTGVSFHDVSKQNSTMTDQPLMVQPEQQWRPPQQPSFLEGFTVEHTHYPYSTKTRDEDNEDHDDGDDCVDNDDDDDTMEDEGLGSYEISTNKLSSLNPVQ